MESNTYKSRYKIAILVIVLLAAVYAISQYTRKHEAKESSTPGPINAPVNESAGPK